MYDADTLHNAPSVLNSVSLHCTASLVFVT